MQEKSTTQHMPAFVFYSSFVVGLCGDLYSNLLPSYISCSPSKFSRTGQGAAHFMSARQLLLSRSVCWYINRPTRAKFCSTPELHTSSAYQGHFSGAQNSAQLSVQKEKTTTPPGGPCNAVLNSQCFHPSIGLRYFHTQQFLRAVLSMLRVIYYCKYICMTIQHSTSLQISPISCFSSVASHLCPTSTTALLPAPYSFGSLVLLPWQGAWNAQNDNLSSKSQDAGPRDLPQGALPSIVFDSQFAKDQLCTNSTQCGSTVRHGHNAKGAIIVWKLRETFQRECLSCKLPYPRRSPTRQGTLGCCVTLRVLCRGRARGAGVRVQDAFYPSPIYTPGKESAEGCAAQPKAVTAPPWLLHCATLLPV